ncbi:MAG: thioredoxin family protein [Rhodomicrobium sp.]
MKLLSGALFAIAFACLGVAPAAAAETAAFTPAAFEAAQKAGEPILVDISATWCSTCKAQALILNKLFSEPKFKNLHVFDIDFDSQKDSMRKFGAQDRATLIVFKGTKEEGRSVFDTNQASIEALLGKGL